MSKKQGKSDGARPAQSGRASTRASRPTRITSAELDRRRKLQEIEQGMIVLRNTMELVLLELQKYQGAPESEEE